jgi:hypothetical protein
MASPLQVGGGDGTSGGMDSWQASVESRLGQLHTDVTEMRKDLGGKIDSNFKVLLGFYGGGFVILGGMIIVGYLRLADLIVALHH